MKIGTQTVKIETPVFIISTSSIVGKKEGEGPLSKYFDTIVEDAYYGESSWEKAEGKLIKEAVSKAVDKSGKTGGEIDYMFAGDLLNQCASSSFGLKEVGIPFFGLYGACSTMIEAMSLSSMIISGGHANTCVAATSSHFCSAEKQFRFPLEYGSQRSLTSQWTVTGAGAAVLSNQGSGPKITYVTTGKIVDKGIKDTNNMGAAMAPAASELIHAHFKDTGLKPEYYDLIITGDLAKHGRDITCDLLKEYDIYLGNNFVDSSIMIFSEDQDVHCGGSGCACIATVFGGYLYDQLLKQHYKKILLIGTGALMNPTTALQGENILGIAHAVSVEI